MFKLPDLPYESSAFGSWLSSESFEFHYGKHHKAYVDKLNAAIEGKAQAEQSLEQIVKEAKGGLFNNAAQAWNHTFFWHCLTPQTLSPSSELESAIKSSFGSIDDFKTKFKEASAGQFGSGWGWLVKDGSGKLEIVTTANAETPITGDKTPILTCDVWEHAYYIDHRNARPSFLDGYMKHINWDFASKNYANSGTPDMTKLMK